MDLLVHLVTNRGSVVTKDQLHQSVWKDVIVNEETLRKSVSTLRQHFTLNGDGSDLELETIRGVGYRLSNTITEVNKWSQYALNTRLFIEQLFTRPAILYLGIVSFFISLTTIFFSFDSTSPKLQTITHGRSTERVPRFSNSGKEMIVARRSGYGINLDIVKYDLKTKQYEQITADLGLETDPTWSPDDSQIVYYQSDGIRFNILAVDLETKERKILGHADKIPNLSAMDWSPTEDVIALSEAADKKLPFRVYGLNTKTLERITITNPELNSVGDVNPRFSPDGTRLAFLRCTRWSKQHGQIIHGSGDIFIKDLKSGKLHQLTYTDGDIAGLDWSSDGKSLYFIDVKNSFNFRVNQLNLATNESVVIHESDRIIRNIDVRNNQLLFEEWEDQYDIVEFSADEAFQIKEELVSHSRNWAPRLSPSGEDIAFLSTKSGLTELWLKSSKANAPEQLTSLNQGMMTPPVWTPDGNKIFFSVNIDDDWNIYEYDFTDGSTKAIIETDRFESRPALNPSQYLMYFIAEYDGAKAIWEKNLKNGDIKKLFTINASNIHYKDGEIFFSRTDKCGLWKLNLETGEPTNIVDNLQVWDEDNWMVHSSGEIYYIKRGSYFRDAALIKVDSTGAANHISVLEALIPYYPGFYVSKDGKSIYSTYSEAKFSEVKMLRL